MKRNRIRLSEAQLHDIIKDAINEVTDYGNNIFGSTRINPSIPSKYDDSDQSQLISLKRKAYDDGILTGQDFHLNYAKDAYDTIWLYGTTEDRSDTISRLKALYNENGWSLSAKDKTGWSGYDTFPQTVISITKEDKQSQESISMKKQAIRLSEAQLRQVIKESVRKVLMEGSQQYLGGQYGQQQAEYLLQKINQAIQNNPNATIAWDSHGARYFATPNNGAYTVSAQSSYGSTKCGTASNAQEIVRIWLNS